MPATPHEQKRERERENMYTHAVRTASSYQTTFRSQPNLRWEQNNKSSSNNTRKRNRENCVCEKREIEGCGGGIRKTRNWWFAIQIIPLAVDIIFFFFYFFILLLFEYVATFPLRSVQISWTTAPAGSAVQLSEHVVHRYQFEYLRCGGMQS